MLFTRFSLAVLFILVALVGCVAVGNIKYPLVWPAQSKVESGICPRLEGRYDNAGLVAGDCYKNEYYYRWDCDAKLSSNIRPSLKAEEFEANIRWVELHQPDSDTLIVQHELGEEPLTLKRSNGDFTCGSDGLTLSRTGSAFRENKNLDEATLAMTMAVLGSPIVSNLSRSFRRTEDGSLLMEVSESSGGVTLWVLPVVAHRNYYVRWEIYNPREKD